MAQRARAGRGTGETARYAAVAAALRAAIAAGRHPVGSSLPSERELMERHGVSRGTVRHALRILVDEGAVAIRRGARPVVLAAPRQPEQTLSELLSFSAWARSLGAEPSGRVVSVVRRAADQRDVERLGGEVGAPVWDVVRVRTLDGRPVMVERSTYPHHVGRVVAGLDLDRCSITAELPAHGIVFARARHTLDAIGASAGDAELLGVPAGTPLLRMRRAATAPDGTPIEWGEDHYLGDAVAFVVDSAARSPHLRRAGPVAEPPGT